MTSRLSALSVDAVEPLRLARFWAGVLGREMADDPHDVALSPGDGTGFRIRFVPTRDRKTGRNWTHFELTSETPEAQRRTVARALELGGEHYDVGQLPDEKHVVLADPEGNEFCVIEPGNRFLAGCGFLGALSCDGTREVGHFWSAALGWPLVWDQNEETAIQSPDGGPKIAWGGPPLMPKPARNRLRFDLAPPPGGDRDEEVERLLSLGATRIDSERAEPGPVAMADPDGNEFCVLTPR
ncbi:VOC family protein [Amorphoplanes digitatis]|uniref:Catechol 2,3-dioxygenase-like lactoylglutathione lyase family enzyme n=1 Tax=Actinoplanes digitatis TaxID=1868 RepID=A0A7W7MS51_9ACTN|nr:VOC family protein [Actinoplanes digitatis]MBB4764285.1 catechol 2,3-dioxygenase-like lactoylglutathione lyase family enzyme [Actinoplanes digitatis]